VKREKGTADGATVRRSEEVGPREIHDISPPVPFASAEEVASQNSYGEVV
jgi:hypothetical protein